ncbi:UNVERIFIED_CONTAM: hypothetical protein Sangu_2831500 [Sesamum angustifolium]|uniref:Uncharacterized protein n=1 Tax=Sesamum angustifolium TaxID=2727405 RepID=A0AAW2IPI7_9LAMI
MWAKNRLLVIFSNFTLPISSPLNVSIPSPATPPNSTEYSTATNDRDDGPFAGYQPLRPVSPSSRVVCPFSPNRITQPTRAPPVLPQPANTMVARFPTSSPGAAISTRSSVV